MQEFLTRGQEDDGTDSNLAQTADNFSCSSRPPLLSGFFFYVIIISTINSSPHVRDEGDDASVLDSVSSVHHHEQPRDIFFKLAKSNTLEVLDLLQTHGKMRLKRIAKSLGETPQNILPTLSALEDIGMLEKTPDGERKLSVYGDNAIRLIDSFQFLDSEKEFFSNHTFEEFPSKFIRRVGVIYGSNRKKGANDYYESVQDIVDSASKYIFLVLQEIPVFAISLLAKKIESATEAGRSLEIRFVFPESENVEKDLYDKLKAHGISREKCNSLEVRQVKDVKVATLLNEKEAVMLFPFVDGRTDIQNFFHNSLENDNYPAKLQELVDVLKIKAGRVEGEKTFGNKRIRKTILERFKKASEILSTNDTTATFAASERLDSVFSEIETLLQSISIDDPPRKTVESLYEGFREQIAEIQGLRMLQERKKEFHMLCLDYFRYKYHENDPLVVAEHSLQYY